MPRPRRLSFRKRLLFAGVGFAGSLVLSLLVVEGALRLLGIGDAGRRSPWFAGGNHPRYLLEPAEATGYRLRPGFEGEIVARTGEFRHPVRVEDLGNRDHRHTAPPRPFVLAAGDSLTFGEGVEAHEAFPALLEESLDVRVVNAGVPGYRSSQIAARARELAETRPPDLVLLTFDAAWDMDRCRNPFAYHEGYLVAESYRDRLQLIGSNLYAEETRRPWIGPLTARLQGHSNLGRLAVPAAFRLLRGGPGAPPAEVPTAWDGCVESILELARETEGHGAGLLIVLAGGFDERGRFLNEEARDRLSRAGLDVVSLAEGLGDLDDPADPLVYPRDRHWNRTGHERVADLLVPVVRESLAGVTRTGDAETEDGVAEDRASVSPH